jgi:acetoin:2,6-dichlorophenolindophenol oxidoreductase subunit alpha
MAGKSRQAIAPAMAETQANKGGFSLISNEKLIQIYATMVKCRMVQERARARMRERGLKGSGFVSTGQEAAFVGAALDLGEEDAIAASQGESMARFLKGEPLEGIFREVEVVARSAGIAGAFRAAKGDRRPVAALPHATIAAQLRAAARIASANGRKSKGKVLVAFSSAEFPASKTGRGTPDFARLEGLPIVFVCLNGHSREPESLKRQAGVDSIAAKAQAHGVAGIAVDGDDAVAVYRVAFEAIARARRGARPTLIECQTWRLPVRPPKVRARSGGKAKAELAGTGEAILNDRILNDPILNDPILNMERYLATKSLFSPGMKRRITRKFKQELDAAIRGAKRPMKSRGARPRGKRTRETGK